MADIAARYLGVTTERLRITKLTGDASTRAYFRAESDSRSVIIALYGSPFDETVSASDHLASLESVNPSARLTFASDPRAHIEATGLFLKGGIPVPRIVGCSGRDAVMLIEDVGDTRLQDWMVSRSEKEVAAAYLHAVGLIGKIQKATELALEADSICAHMAFDEAKLRWELGFFFANYFNRHLHMRLDPATANAVQQDFKVLCAELAARPRVLTHRDYHARNLMMDDGRMFIIDHQDARMGPATYDLTSLINDPYTALDRALADELIERFIVVRADSDMPVSDVEEFRREFQLVTVQRMLKAVGTYASQAALAGNMAYIPYIEPAVGRAIEAMKSLGRFDATRALLESARD